MSVQERFLEVAAAYDRCFWLDGGGGLDWSGRRSLIGWLDEDDVSLVLAGGEVRRRAGGRETVVGTDIFAALEAELAGDGPEIHWVGYFGYAARPDLPARDSDDGVPTAVWMRARRVEVEHHPPAHPRPVPRPDAGSRMPDAAYRTAFERVQEELHAGNSYEVNLTYRVDVESELDPAAAYLRLRELNPAPYAGYLQHGRGAERIRLLSSSPERYAAIDRHRVLETKPIKGTTPRALDPAEDERLRAFLVTDPKMRAENLMIVDLLRNDLAMVCEPGSVEVPGLMQVESYETVHQLVSTVRGRLNADVSTIGALRSLFPAGSMTGAPKLRTMEIIGAVESSPRGVYSGAFGWISGDGRADLGVVIRSLVATPRRGSGWRYRLGTGGGITVRSDVAEEYAESRWKADRLLRVFEDAD